MQTQSAFPVTRSRSGSGAPPAYQPEGLLHAFTLRMSTHGHAVRRNMMVCDHRYAVKQLAYACAYANTLPDDSLREMALELFRQMQEEQSGVFHEV